jgi:TolB-like protein
MSGDPEQQYFCDGMTEDIITELSRFRQMRVVSRNSSSRFRGQDIDMVKAAAELGADYLAEGSVRRMGARVRITVQLIEARAGSHVWAERYDCAQDELFDMQDQIVRRIVGTLSGRMNAAGIEMARRKPPASMAAYDYVLRGDALPVGTAAGTAEAIVLFRRAIEIDPGYARAYALLSFALSREWYQDTSGSNRLRDESAEMAFKAGALDENDTLCQLAVAWAHLYRGSHERAARYFDKALVLNPNQPSTLTDVAIFQNYSGEPQKAIDGLLRAKGLDPFFDPSWFWGELSAAYFNARRYDDAIAAMQRSPDLSLWQRVWLAACYAKTDRLDLACECADAVMRAMPGFSTEKFLAKEPLARQEDRVHLGESLRAAGLPQ